MCVYSEISLIEVEVGEKGTAKKRMVFVLFFGGAPVTTTTHPPSQPLKASSRYGAFSSGQV